MRVLFICWRPYQIINAINFVVNNIEQAKGNADIIVVDDFRHSEKVYSRIKKENIFNDVFYAKMESERSNVEIIKNLLFPRMFIKNKFGKTFDFKYDTIIASGWNYLVYKFYEVNNKNVRMILFDDGVGSYLGDNRTIEFKGYKQRIVAKFLNRGPFSVKISAQYLNQDGLINPLNFDYPIIRSELNLHDEMFANTIKRVFGIDQNKKEQSPKVIILDQPIFYENDISNDEIKYKLFEKINNLFSPVPIVYRPHPNQKNIWDGESVNAMLQDTDVPWEFYVMNSITDKDILFSFHSTAITVPKLMFNIEPTVCYLYKIINNLEDREEISFEEYLNKFESLYKAPEKIYIPNSENELEDMIEVCRETIYKNT